MLPTAYKITCLSEPAHNRTFTRPAHIFLYDAIRALYPGHALSPLELRGYNEHGATYVAILDNHTLKIIPTN